MTAVSVFTGLQSRSITSHLPFTRLCSYSVNNIHLICYWKLVWEQCQTYSLIWTVPLVVSRAFLAATLISGSTDSYFPRLIQSDRSCPKASGKWDLCPCFCVKKGNKAAHESEFLSSSLDWIHHVDHEKGRFLMAYSNLAIQLACWIGLGVLQWIIEG